MRRISTVVAVAVAGTIVGFQPVRAGLLGMPMGLQSVIQHIRFETPTLAADGVYAVLPALSGSVPREDGVSGRSGRAHRGALGGPERD